MKVVIRIALSYKLKLISRNLYCLLDICQSNKSIYNQFITCQLRSLINTSYLLNGSNESWMSLPDEFTIYIYIYVYEVFLRNKVSLTIFE